MSFALLLVLLMSVCPCALSPSGISGHLWWFPQTWDLVQELSFPLSLLASRGSAGWFVPALFQCKKGQRALSLSWGAGEGWDSQTWGGIGKKPFGEGIVWSLLGLKKLNQTPV